MKGYLVLNGDKTEGFFTTEYQLAYEVRKGSDTNCSHADGTWSDVGEAFCASYMEDDCTIQEININQQTESK